MSATQARPVPTTLRQRQPVNLFRSTQLPAAQRHQQQQLNGLWSLQLRHTRTGRYGTTQLLATACGTELFQLTLQ